MPPFFAFINASYLRMKTFVYPLLIVALLVGCHSVDQVTHDRFNDNIIELPYVPLYTNDSLSWQNLPACAQVAEILSRTESPQVVTNATLRSFNVSEVVQTRLLAPDSIQVTSYSAKPIQAVDLYLHLSSYVEPILIAHIDSLPAFGRITFKPTFLSAQGGVYRTLSGRTVTFRFDKLLPEAMTLSTHSTDPHYQMLQRITARWQLSFSSYSGSQWAEMRWLYAREWCVMVQNLAYLFHTEAFRYVWFNYNTIMGADLYDNNGTLFTPETYASVYQSIFAKERLVLGVTQMGGGLGGGATWGVDHWMFYGHYSSFHGMDIIAHEFAHTLGFSHSSAMASGGGRFKFQNFITEMHDYLIDRGELPYLLEDRFAVDFANPINQEFWHNGIVESWITDERETELERYFAANPLH